MDQQEQVSLELEEVDMYVLFARMFAHIARKVEQACGEKGIEAVRAGVRSFGEERGRHMRCSQSYPQFLPIWAISYH